MSFIDRFKKFMTSNDYKSRYVIPPSPNFRKYLVDCASESDNSCSTDYTCAAFNEPCQSDGACSSDCSSDGCPVQCNLTCPDLNSCSSDNPCPNACALECPTFGVPCTSDIQNT